MYMIDLQSRVPIYEQLYGCVKNMLMDGEIKPGDKLPSVREMSKELGVNPNTVTKAFQALERDKIIYTVPGRGSYAADIINDKFRQTALDEFDKASQNALRLGVSADTLIQRIKEMGS